MDSDELASCLRTWRDRLTPADVGLPVGGTRRAPGLRREEVANLAGLSVDYLARLEQGRATHPSPSVLGPLARALRLSNDERDHLYRVAGHAAPADGTMNRHITPGIQRMLDRLGDVPVMVVDGAWTIIAMNPLATALMGELPDDERARNTVWRQFTGAPSRLVRTEEEIATMEAQCVADLHDVLGRHPADEGLRSLVDDLLEASPRFAALWEEHPVAQHVAMRKTFAHPEVGEITVDCDHLAVAGTDLRLIVYTVPPGSSDANALALLGAVGLQSFSA
jgi:transcriptional regulator with XRE-family HTH domain